MNCDEIRELLSEGRPLTGSAEKHLASCAACRAMVEALTLPEVPLDQERVDRIQKVIAASLTRVRPLPSDWTLVWSLLALFIAFSLIAAIPVGYNGFHVLDAYRRSAYYGLILLCAAFLAITAVQEMIPGSQRKITPRWTIVAAMLSLALLAWLLFQNFNLDRFVPLGIPCLRLGVICAVISGALFWLIVRKGFFSSPVAAWAAVGFFAGLAGVAVLALHCPIQNSAHIIVWHLGAMAVGGVGGALVGTPRR